MTEDIAEEDGVETPPPTPPPAPAPTMKDIIHGFQGDVVDYLYDMEPQSQNLFWAGYFNCGDNEKFGLPINNTPRENRWHGFINAPFRITKVSIPLPKMQMDAHPVLRIPMFKDISFPQEITIEWKEDVYHSVQKYHADWFGRWYNRQYDVLRCGVQGKFRRLTVVAYNFVNISNISSFINTPDVQPIMRFDIGGLAPLEFGDMNFDVSADQNDQLVSCKYKFGKLWWTYYDNIQYWKPTGIGNENPNTSGEAGRLSGLLVSNNYNKAIG